MSSPFASALPCEVWSDALAYLPLRDLASASVVSHSWQILAFSHLYHTVYLTRPSHLEQLAARVILKVNPALSLYWHARTRTGRRRRAEGC
jgi:hypothetical protein